MSTASFTATGARTTLPRDLFWGPKHAEAFIRIQRPVDESGWLDDVWAEGGALLDLGRKHLLFFGGEDLLYHVPLRRTYFELLAKVWHRWTIRWAYEGIADLADYVGYPREKVLSKGEQDFTDGLLTPPVEKDWTDLVASARLEDGNLRLYPLAGDVASYLSCGPKLADNIRTTEGLRRLRLDEWTTEFPTGGFHVDLSGQRLEFWSARAEPDIPNRVATAWPGWKTLWLRDAFERQLERAEGSLRFPLLDRAALLDWCRKILLVETTKSPVDTVKMLVERDREQGKDVQVNSWALRHDRLELPTEERRAILDEAVSLL